MRYVLIETFTFYHHGGTASSHIEKVNAMIQTGWRPQGGVQVVVFDRKYDGQMQTLIAYVQAMVQDDLSV